MYTPATVIACLAPLLGFHQSPPDVADEPQLDTPLLAALEAVAVQDIHPLLTTRNIYLSAPELPTALTPSPPQEGEEPAPVALTPFSQYLDRARRAAAGKVLTAFVANKKLSGTGKSILANVPLTAQSGEYRRKVIKQGRFVGLALTLQPGKDVTLTVTGLGTQFTELNPEFRLYLYHSSSLSPVASYDVPRTTRVSFDWTEVTIPLLAALAGGEYRLGYFEDDLVGQAIDLQNDFSRRPGACCTSDYQNWDKWAPLVSVRAFSLPSDPDTDALPDATPTYHPDSNFGLNLRLSATCDLSSYLCQYKGLFLEALQQQLAVDLLEVMANTTRNNGISAQTQTLALVELNNKPNDQPGLRSRLTTALAALDVDLSQVAAPCRPCAAKAGAVKVGVV